MCFFTLILINCKRNQDTDIVSKTFVPAKIDLTQPGIIQTSTPYVILHKNNQVTTSAKLYNSDGMLFSTQPTFIWSSDNADIASCNNGIISANNIGSATISVTDGSHGFAFINVSVVDDTTNIASNQPVSIVFNPIIQYISKNQTRSFTYTLLNGAGQTISGTPVFNIVGNNSGISVSGNTIQSSATEGLFTIEASINNQRLAGNLNIVVADTTRTTTDTSWYLVGWTIAKAPVAFNYSNKTSSPVRITVYELNYSMPGIFPRVRQTSPESIDISNPEIITDNGSGLLRSTQQHGGTTITAHYGNINYSWNAVNYFDLTGSWGGTSNGKSYNFCFLPKQPDVLYIDHLRMYESVNHYDGSTYAYLWGKIYKTQYAVDACANEYLGGGTLPSLYTRDGKGSEYLGGFWSTSCDNISYIASITSFNTIELNYNNQKFTITRGIGNCTATTNDSQYAKIDGVYHNLLLLPSNDTSDYSLFSPTSSEPYYIYEMVSENGTIDGSTGNIYNGYVYHIEFYYKSSNRSFGTTSRNTLYYDPYYITDPLLNLNSTNCLILFIYASVINGNETGYYYTSTNNGTCKYENGYLHFTGIFDKTADGIAQPYLGTTNLDVRIKFQY